MDRLAKITKNGRAMILAYDHGLEHGPADFDENSVDPKFIFNLAVTGKFTAILTHRGIAENYYPQYKHDIPLILKLNGKTNLTETEPFSPLLADVAEARRLGASAVGYTVYPGSSYEERMLNTLSEIVSDAHRLHMPVIGWMYPRGGKVTDDTAPEVIAYAARIGFELGCDMVKVKYPGSQEAMHHVVTCAQSTKVVVAGGTKMAETELYEEVGHIMQAGACGIAIGRNIWQQRNPLGIATQLESLVLK